MSKGLIEKLLAAAEFRNNEVGDLFKEAAAALEAKAAAVGELEAFEAWWVPLAFDRITPSQLALMAYQAGASWQRQAGVVPAGWRLVPEFPTDEMLLAGYAEVAPDILLCTVWEAMLAAVPSTPATVQGEYGYAYQGAREDLAIWKRRALEAEARVRQQDQIIDQMGEDLNAMNGPTFMGEPVLPRESEEPVEWRCRVAGSDHWAHFPTKRCRFCEPLYAAPQPSEAVLTAEDVRTACIDATAVFADEADADKCREVAEYMREVLLARLARLSEVREVADV